MDSAGRQSRADGLLIDLVPTFLGRLDAVLADPWAVAAQDYVCEHLANERPPKPQRSPNSRQH